MCIYRPAPRPCAIGYNDGLLWRVLVCLIACCFGCCRQVSTVLALSDACLFSGQTGDLPKQETPSDLFVVRCFFCEQTDDCPKCEGPSAFDVLGSRSLFYTKMGRQKETCLLGVLQVLSLG
jgi:hypothetical protein